GVGVGSLGAQARALRLHRGDHPHGVPAHGLHRRPPVDAVRVDLDRAVPPVRRRGPAGERHAETFPTSSRTAKIGFAYSLATAVFGGTTPYVNELAVSQGVPWASNLFIAFAAALALWAAWRLPERKGIDLTIVR